MLACGGCVSDHFDERSEVGSYQRTVEAMSPQPRASEGEESGDPIGLLQPSVSGHPGGADFAIRVDPNTGRRFAELRIEEAVFRALAHSPEIAIVSFDPSIARQEIRKAAAGFDPTFFSQLNYEDEDNPENSIFQPGQAETRLFESGVRQRITTGAEWSASYALTRAWDDLTGRTLPTRYEPVLAFQLKQPLLRDAWEEVNLAGVDIARLEHQIALLGFRERAEEVSTEVIRAYWQLVQARRDLEIQRQLVAQTIRTVEKVEGRRGIDATDVQIQQARSYAKSRQAFLLHFRKQRDDAQDMLVRLITDRQANLTSETEIIPVTAPETRGAALEGPLDVGTALTLAMASHPVIQRAKAAVEVAEINVRVAKNQRMPRLDLVTSARTQGLDRERAAASGQLLDGDYASYAVGLTFEFPLGNRDKDAELKKRRLERRKAISVLHSVADQIGVQVKERIRRVNTSLMEIKLQNDAAEAARAHLQALEDSEMVRERLTAEFLLVKLQAQEILAQAERAKSRATAALNTSIAELAQATGSVFDLHLIDDALTSITGTAADEDGSAPHLDG
jgi:outer membrane protein TolC